MILTSAVPGWSGILPVTKVSTHHYISFHTREWKFVCAPRLGNLRPSTTSCRSSDPISEDDLSVLFSYLLLNILQMARDIPRLVLPLSTENQLPHIFKLRLSSPSPVLELLSTTDYDQFPRCTVLYSWQDPVSKEPIENLLARRQSNVM